MSTNNPGKKKKVVTPQKKKVVVTQKKKITPTSSKTKASTPVLDQQELFYGKKQYILMGVGVVLIALGLFLMGGGKMPSTDVWDDGIIYSFRRTVLAPIVILAGLVVEIFAIFRR